MNLRALNMAYKTLLLISMSLLLAACSANGGTHDTNQQSLTAPVIFPDELIRFHIEQQENSNSLLIMTYFPVSKQDEFNAIQISPIGNITVWYGVTSAGGRGMVLGDLTLDEKNRVLEIVDFIADKSLTSKHTSVNLQEGEYIFTVSLGKWNDFRVLSCVNTDCPVELCELFTMTNRIIKEQGRAGILSCPIPTP